MRYLFVLFMLIGWNSSHAQSKYRKKLNFPKVALKNNVLSYMINTIYLALECQVKGRHTIQGVIQLNGERDRHEDWLMSNGAKMRTQGYALGVEYRFYTNADKGVMHGFYVSPYFRFFYRDIVYIPFYQKPPIPGPYGNVTFKRDVYSFGFMIGVQKLSRRLLGYDFFIGLGTRNINDYDIKYEIGEPYGFDNFIDRGSGELRLGFSIILSNA